MTQKMIGPSFYNELVAHGGLIGEHFTWSADGVLEFFDDTPEPVVAGVEAVYAAHDPSRLAAAPTQVTMRQARLALLVAGKLHLVDSTIAQLPSPQREAAQIEWEFAATVDRDSPIVALLRPALGLDGDALDDLFIQAADL